MHCSETYGKSIFQFLQFSVYEIWFFKILRIFFVPKMRNVLKRIFAQIWQIFNFWNMVDFVLNIRNELGTWRIQKKKNYARGTPPQAPRAFGVNPLIQLVIKYHHWLALLNQVSNFLRTLSITSTIFQKIKIVQFSAKFVTKHCASLERFFSSDDSEYFERLYLEN